MPETSASTGRQRFRVELKDETNLVSWRKLLKNAPAPATVAPPGANPALEARIAPEAPAAAVAKDPFLAQQAPPNRFNEVIERIERLYQGQDSGDEDDPNTIADDQYNTDDSFIDDEELDDYFSVERTKTKHQGFFINKGKLEKINEPSPSPPPVLVPKKRKRKEEEVSKRVLVKGEGALTLPNGESRMSVGAKTSHQHGTGNKIVRSVSSSSKAGSAGFSDQKTKLAPHLIKSKGLVLKGDGGGQAVQALRANASNNKSSGLGNINKPDAGKYTAERKSIGSSSPIKLKHLPKYPVSTERKDARGSVLQTASVKDRPKGTILERAIQDLKTGVAELCPDEQVVEQGKVKRLPREIKQKIAKVARLAAKQGKIPDELIERLMGILGHLMQLKTLKRNLKEMVEMGLHLKKEKEGKIQDSKREITEMVRLRVSMQDKAENMDQHHTGAGSSEKTGVRSQYKWDEATEDHLYDLYEKYLEGIDEDKGPQSLKVYGELEKIWPEGWMDKNGIKMAVCRARQRKKNSLMKSQNLGEPKKRANANVNIQERGKVCENRGEVQKGESQERMMTMMKEERVSDCVVVKSQELPSSAVQAGKPAILRKQQFHKGLLIEKTPPFPSKEKNFTPKQEYNEEEKFIRFRKQQQQQTVIAEEK